MSGWLLRVVVRLCIVLAGIVFGAGAVGAITPPGPQVAFEYGLNLGASDIFLADVVRGMVVNLTHSPGAHDTVVGWVPGRYQLLFVRKLETHPPALYMWDDASVRKLYEAIGVSPTLSPDGTQVAFAVGEPGHRDIVLLNPHSGETRTIANLPPSEDSPVWSAQNTIAYEVSGHGSYEIWTYAADGTVTQLIGDANTPSTFFAPVWSPDGTRLAYRWSIEHTSGLSVMDADGSNVQTIARDQFGIVAAWHPAGEWLVFERNLQLVLANLDDLQPRSVINNAVDPVWSPDGQWLAYRSGGSLKVVRAEAVFDPDAPVRAQTVWAGDDIVGSAVWRP